jgi:hypothetical protein
MYSVLYLWIVKCEYYLSQAHIQGGGVHLPRIISSNKEKIVLLYCGTICIAKFCKLLSKFFFVYMHGLSIYIIFKFEINRLYHKKTYEQSYKYCSRPGSIQMYTCIVMNIFRSVFLNSNTMADTLSVLNYSNIQMYLNLTIYTFEDYNIVGYPEKKQIYL